MTETTREITNKPARYGLVAAAVISSTLVWLIADLMGLDVAVTMNGTVQAISGVTVAVSATVASLGAWGVKAATERMFRHPTAWWVTIAIAVGVLSLLGPLTMATSATASAVLVVMHVVPAAILIPGLARTGPRKGRGFMKYRRDPNSNGSAKAASMESGYGGAP